jgi:hypothetical protein
LGISTPTVPAPGQRRDDADAARLHGEREIVLERDDAADLDAGGRLELEHGHDRPRMDLGDATIDIEVGELGDEQIGLRGEVARGDEVLGLLRQVEDRERRQRLGGHRAGRARRLGRHAASAWAAP